MYTYTSTKASTELGICVWEEWSLNRLDDSSDHGPANVPLLEMSVPDLSYWMGKFILEVRRKTEKGTQPNLCMHAICVLLQMFL